METFKSSNFGMVQQPSSFQELIELSLDPAPDDYRAVRMWRGQGDISWPLHSTAYRRLMNASYLSGGTVPNEIDIRNHEKGLLKSADHKGYRYQDGRRLPDFELLARLRHHGAATRLIDFTRNLLAGLWFCSIATPDKTGLLIGIHAHYIGGYEGEPEERDYGDVVSDLSEYDHPITWEPSPNSARVAAQHSQFLYSALSKEKTESLVLPKDDGSVLAIAVKPEFKAEAKKILSEVFDIRRTTLFPDFDGFGNSRSVDVHPSEDHRW